MKKYLVIVIVGLLGLLGLLGRWLVESRDECERLRGNQESLMQEVKLYENRLGESVASVERLLLTKSELENNYAAACEDVRRLGVKVKRLQSVSRSVTAMDMAVRTEVRDSIVWRDRPNTVQAFAWRDPPWVSVEGLIDDCEKVDSLAGSAGNGRNEGCKEVSIEIRAIDSLVQVVHRVPKRFLFFRFGTKAIRQEVVSKNPYVKVVYSEYIEIEK